MQAFQSGCRRHFSVASLRWYYSHDLFFARFPSSGALRVYLIDTPDDRSALSQALSQAREITLA
jgi:hypothetical protein